MCPLPVNQIYYFMKIIPTKTHGYIDYIVGLLLIAAPWLFDFYKGGAETWVPVILGAGTIVYSLMTDYELGFSRTISMGTHLTVDMVAGLLLAVSPWLFGFAEDIWEPHLIVGILEIGIAFLTKRTPATDSGHMHRRTAATH
jgi:hypothetical protein